MFKCDFNKDVYIVSDEKRPNQRASVSVTIADCFVITGIKVMDGANGLFVAMPSFKKNDGTFKDTMFPITKEAREDLNAVVLEAYNEKVASQAA